jgi:hypothetical protein
LKKMADGVWPPAPRTLAITWMIPTLRPGMFAICELSRMLRHWAVTGILICCSSLRLSAAWAGAEMRATERRRTAEKRRKEAIFREELKELEAAACRIKGEEKRMQNGVWKMWALGSGIYSSHSEGAWQLLLQASLGQLTGCHIVHRSDCR